MSSEHVQNIKHLPGETGLPSYYPVPEDSDSLLFYIQRNQNENTVIYELNSTHCDMINLDLPMVASWIQYKWGGVKKELNLIQSKLAYGYHSWEIAKELIEFQFVSYDKLKFYITRHPKTTKYIATTTLNGKMARLKNIYVYAHEMGVFPDVKYIELYGEDLNTGLPMYQKIMIER